MVVQVGQPVRAQDDYVVLLQAKALVGEVHRAGPDLRLWRARIEHYVFVVHESALPLYGSRRETECAHIVGRVHVAVVETEGRGDFRLLRARIVADAYRHARGDPFLQRLHKYLARLRAEMEGVNRHIYRLASLAYVIGEALGYLFSCL